MDHAAPLDPVAEWYGKFVKARALEAEAKAHKEEAKAMLASYLDENDAEYGTISGVPRLRYRSYNKRRFDTKGFYADHPDLAEEYYIEAPERRMEVIDND